MLLYREREEDLEKRQFFINRELRSLASLTGTSLILLCISFYYILEDQKTKEQREREEHLIQELLVLVNEREWLDQRLTNTTQ